ncbi:MAG: hypothetical protein NVS9B1_21430 [Candidatus Dormibacteraceae bacterium]
MERQERYRGDPLRLPRLPEDSIPRLTGDRRPGVRFCSGCGSTLETAIVTRGYWTYCSIECAIRTERHSD